VCVECDALAETKARAWEAHLADVDDDGEDEVVFICARCAHREFHSQDLVDPPSLDYDGLRYRGGNTHAR